MVLVAVASSSRAGMSTKAAARADVRNMFDI
jgi:hypothetical protein